MNKEAKPFAWWLIPIRTAQVVFFPLVFTAILTVSAVWLVLHPLTWLGALLWGWLRHGDSMHYFWRGETNMVRCHGLLPATVGSGGTRYCSWEQPVGNDLPAQTNYHSSQTPHVGSPVYRVGEIKDVFLLPGKDLDKVIWAAWWRQPTPRPPHPKPTTF